MLLDQNMYSFIDYIFPKKHYRDPKLLKSCVFIYTYCFINASTDNKHDALAHNKIVYGLFLDF